MQKLYSEEFEKCVLGCMLLDNSIIDDVISKIKKDCFCIGQNSLFFDKIVSLYNESGSCDIVMLSQAIPNKVKEIASLTDVVPSSVNYEYYVNEIKKFYIARQYRNFAQEQANTINEKTVDEILYKTDDFINDCMSDNKKTEPVNAKQMAVTAIERLQYKINHAGELSGLDTGFERLNQLTDGFQNGDLIALGARASIGKSAFSDQLCVNIASKGIKTCTFSLEMTSEQVGERRISGLSNVPMNKMRSGFITSADVQRVQNAATKLYEYNDNLLLYDSRSIGCEFNEIVSKIRIHAKQGYKIFFIDHIGLVDCADRENCPEWERISYMTKRLKQIANKLNIVIVIVCQLTRDSEGKEPQLNNLRGSGSIEQDANTVILIHRDRQKNDEIMIPTTIKVLKDRNGSCGDIDFNFFPKTCKFEEVDEDNRNVNFEVKKVNNKNSLKETEKKDFYKMEDMPF